MKNAARLSSIFCFSKRFNARKVMQNNKVPVPYITMSPHRAVGVIEWIGYCKDERSSNFPNKRFENPHQKINYNADKILLFIILWYIDFTNIHIICIIKVDAILHLLLLYFIL